jgi:hypothetical protein
MGTSVCTRSVMIRCGCVQDTLTRAQYAVAGSVLLAIFLGFYVGFGALVLAQRWPPFAKHVAPLAVLVSQYATHTRQS